MSVCTIDLEFVSICDEGTMTIVPVSFGAVSEYDELYLEFDIMSIKEAQDLHEQDSGGPWFSQNVAPGLRGTPTPLDKAQALIKNFLKRNAIRHVYSWGSLLDGAALVAVFGGWQRLPPAMKRGIIDLKTECQGTGITTRPTHNALSDAREAYTAMARLEFRS